MKKKLMLLQNKKDKQG